MLPMCRRDNYESNLRLRANLVEDARAGRQSLTAICSRVLSRTMRLGPLLQTIGDPCLDHRLARDAESMSFAVEGLDHPQWKIDVDAPDVTVGARHLRQIEVVDDVLEAVVELLVELTGFHMPPPPSLVTGAPR